MHPIYAAMFVIMLGGALTALGVAAAAIGIQNLLTHTEIAKQTSSGKE